MSPTHTVVEKYLERLLPGSAQGVVRLREQIVLFAVNPTAKTALIRGPIGAGKSTVARAIGLLKRAAPLKRTEAARLLEDAKYDAPNRIELNYIPWFVELPLTGLVESLADLQLFGATKGAFTGAASQRSGVFEQAATGRMGPGKEPPAGAKMTGGVVFLDEIGDLDPALQAKLLPVLSGAPFYRLGGEGQVQHTLRFDGVTIAASWKRLDDGTVRPDLLSRLMSNVIDVPGLADRAGDFELVCSQVEEAVINEATAAIDHILLVEPEADRDYWMQRKEQLKALSASERSRLSSINWNTHGNLRGLSGLVRRIIAGGQDLEAVLGELPSLRAELPGDPVSLLLARLNERSADGSGLAGHLQAIEVAHRRLLKEDLLGNPSTRSRLAVQLDLDEDTLMSQIHQLGRRRQRRSKSQ